MPNMHCRKFLFDTGISMVEMTATALTPEQSLKQMHMKFVAERGTEPAGVYWVLHNNEIYNLIEFLPGHSRFNGIGGHKVRSFYANIELRDKDWGILSNRVDHLPRKAD